MSALLISGCGMSAASASSEQTALDADVPVQRISTEEAEMSAGEGDYFGGSPPMAGSAPSNRKAKILADYAVNGPPSTDTIQPEDAAEASGAFEEETSAKPEAPLLIYQADLALGVFRVQENLDRIEKIALNLGGYLVMRGEQRITVRVPAKDFEQTVDAVIDLGDVHRREITAQDVTAEFLDVQIRLKNALAMRERLEQLLQKATNVKEALQVEEQLGRVAEQIELMKGRLKYLREVTSFSTISVEFAERSAPIDTRVKLPFEWLRDLGLNSLLSL